jgi:hypothetical protein
VKHINTKVQHLNVAIQQVLSMRHTLAGSTLSQDLPTHRKRHLSETKSEKDDLSAKNGYNAEGEPQGTK